MALGSEAVARLLRAKADADADDGSGDVVFALFLEPHAPVSDASFADRLITFAVNNLQRAPVMAHVELFVPCPAGSCLPVNFATYIGERSNWQTSKANNESYYIAQNVNRWRAVPIFGKQAARLVRASCDASVDLEYSMLRYITAWWPLRPLSVFVSADQRAPAHCATLTSRILRRSVGACLKHNSNWYSPASLYRELSADLAEQRISPASTLMAVSTAACVQCLLHESSDEVVKLSDESATNAFRALTLKVAAAEAHGDSAAQVLAQRQLASALLRWSVSRLDRDCGSVNMLLKLKAL